MFDSPIYGEPNLGTIIDQVDLKSAQECLAQSASVHIGFGPDDPAIMEFESKFAKKVDERMCFVSVANNGVAFDTLLNVCGFSGKEKNIVLPALGFKAWHMAAVRASLSITYADCDTNKLNSSVNPFLKALDQSTVAVCPVSLDGSVDEFFGLYTAIKQTKPNVLVVADLARSLGQLSDSRSVFDYADVAIYSFHSAKIISTLGEGGMIGFKDRKLAEEFRLASKYGGEFGWGTNIKLSKVAAAVGVSQLDKLEQLLKRRRECSDSYHDILSETLEIFNFLNSDYDDSSHYYFPVKVRENIPFPLDQFLRYLNENYNIFPSVPKVIFDRWSYLHKHTKGRAPIAEQLSKQSFCLPTNPNFNRKTIEALGQCVKETVNRLVG
jgi:perosamine synthetase